ncbi:formate/nitrite transporter family protein [uncultured Allobaculum sp.]|uniref:formate/nitrite transporter family protein n=1 Tax=uncultured Allobaculum sp. TaxID=1187017 RepID=UPI0025934459|nr:formate/nitrite transporter family protein [uncultured Allobaculum sp.]
MKKSIAAGGMIAIAAYLFLRAEAPLGALFFGFGLAFVIIYQLDLFTGKIGFFGEHDLPFLRILLGNLIGAGIVCLLLRTNTPVIETAQALVEKKDALSWYVALINGTFCGVLMYLAVSSWKRGFHAGCFLCVTVFILCGFEHSIADFAYMALAWKWSLNLLWILLGNALGAVICRLMVEDKAIFRWPSLQAKAKN